MVLSLSPILNILPHSPGFPLFFFNSSPHSRNGILTEPDLAL